MFPARNEILQSLSKQSEKINSIKTIYFLFFPFFSDHAESFRTGYNTCLVELSGKLMTSTDIDYQTKATLLNTISKLSNQNNPSLRTETTKPSTQVQTNATKSNTSEQHTEPKQLQQASKIPVIQNNTARAGNFHHSSSSAIPTSVNNNNNRPTEKDSQHHIMTASKLHVLPEQQSTPSKILNQPPASNTEKKKRGRKRRTFDYSDIEHVKRCRSNYENFHAQKSKELAKSWNVQLQSTINKDVHENKSASQSNINNNRIPHIQPSQKDPTVNSNAQIAIIKKNEQGELIEISRIPLKALLGNKIHHSVQSMTSIPQQPDSEKQSNKTEALTKQQPHKMIEGNQNPKKPIIGHSDSNGNFSYLKLLQENSDVDQIIMNNQGHFETTPLNVNSKTINPSLPPLNVFLGQY